MLSSIPNEADEDLYLHGKIEAYRAQRRSQLGPCGCIDALHFEKFGAQAKRAQAQRQDQR